MARHARERRPLARTASRRRVPSGLLGMTTSHAATTTLSIAETAAPPRLGWLATACTFLVVVQLAASGAMMIVHPAPVLAMLRHLGYPDYFATMLGVAKVLGAVAIAVPRFAT